MADQPFLQTVTFPHKPRWLNYWQFKQDHVGADIQVIGGKFVTQRFARSGNIGKPIELFCPWITYEDLEDLWTLVNNEVEMTLQPEEDPQTYSVIFRTKDPITNITQVGGGPFPDEDKATAGDPWDRYSCVLNLVVVA